MFQLWHKFPLTKPGVGHLAFRATLSAKVPTVPPPVPGFARNGSQTLQWNAESREVVMPVPQAPADFPAKRRGTS
jgi:hypothetical protein